MEVHGPGTSDNLAYWQERQCCSYVSLSLAIIPSTGNAVVASISVIIFVTAPTPTTTEHHLNLNYSMMEVTKIMSDHTVILLFLFDI